MPDGLDLSGSKNLVYRSRQVKPSWPRSGRAAHWPWPWL